LPRSINYDSPGDIRAFLEEYGLGMRKKYGQNFLINKAIRSKLIEELELEKSEEVWEIGPGLGAMTKGLLETGARLTAFEIDPAFSRALRDFFSSYPTFTLIEGDVFKTWKTVPAGERLFLLGNLPYNIAAAIMGDFIEKQRFFTRMVITVQNEVALRMTAAPGTADYSSFSVLCSSVYKIKPLRIIKGSCFYPVPRVDSRALRLDLLENRVKRPAVFYPLVRRLFSSRRKTIRNTLRDFAASAIIAEDVLKLAGISGERRAETLGLEEFAALASCLEGFVPHG